MNNYKYDIDDEGYLTAQPTRGDVPFGRPRRVGQLSNRNIYFAKRLLESGKATSIRVGSLVVSLPAAQEGQA